MLTFPLLLFLHVEPPHLVAAAAAASADREAAAAAAAAVSALPFPHASSQPRGPRDS